MRRIKPSVFVALGFVWPIIGTFPMMGMTFAFPHLPEGWVRLIIVFTEGILPVLLFVFGLMCSRAKKDAYRKGNVLKYITPAQVCLFAAAVVLVIGLLFHIAELEKLTTAMMIAWVLLIEAALVLFIIRVVRNFKEKKKTRTSYPGTFPPGPQLCSQSGTLSTEDQEKKLHTKCSVCGIDHPKSEMLFVESKYFCQDCFREKYTPGIY